MGYHYGAVLNRLVRSVCEVGLRGCALKAFMGLAGGFRGFLGREAFLFSRAGEYLVLIRKRRGFQGLWVEIAKGVAGNATGCSFGLVVEAPQNLIHP